MNIVGRVVGKYRIVEEIGRGGMAAVFKAYQPTLDRHVAIKILFPQFALKPGFAERFLREARAIAQLNHPNILPIIDFGQDEEELSYIVTKYVTTGTLKDRLQRPIDLVETTRLVKQIAAALDHAHARGFIHRDVKPSNVLIDEGGWALLADFGLVKIVSGTDDLTGTGTSIGTPAYMSPQQARGLPLDHRTDLYSLGIALYEMATGRLPFYGDPPSTVILKHIAEPPPMPRQFKPSLTPEVEAVILKSIAKTPDERYASAGEMASALWQAVARSSGIVEAGIPPVIAPETTPLPGEEGPAGSKDYFERLPPLELTAPTSAAELVGREAELKYFADRLAATRLAVITGMPGVGKTALATQLARRAADSGRILVHAFHEGEGADVVIWKLAGFLAWHGQQDLWRMLQSAQETGSKPPPPEVLFDYFLQLIRKHKYLLLFDNFQFVDDDPLIAQLIERLRSLMQTSEVFLIVASRRAPAFAQGVDLRPLAGLSIADTHTLLTQHGLSLPDDQAAALHIRTEGNPQLLTLAMNALQRTADHSRFISQLAESSDIERYLMTEVDQRLTPDEREVMSAVAVLMDYPGTRDAIEAIAAKGGLRRTLSDLSSRYLLTVGDGERGKTYGHHSIMQDFYYSMLGKPERQEMHRRAGQYYETDQQDALNAARHFAQAGDLERAAQAVVANVWSLINQGQGRPLTQLLAKIKQPPLEAEQWAAVSIAHGHVLSVLGENQPARESYQEALSRLSGLTDSTSVRKLRARACRGMAETWEHESAQEALKWLDRGLDLLAGADAAEEAALHIRAGITHSATGNYEAAVSALERGLSALPEGPSPSRASGLGNLANIYCIQGDIERGKRFYRQALEISEQLHDYWRMVGIWHNLGIEMETAGDWAGAAAEYQKALTQAERLGSTKYQAEVELSLGILNTKQGDYEAANKHLSSCLAVARQRNFSEHLVYGLSSLADLQIRMAEWEAADMTLTEAEELALAIDANPQLPEIYRSWAQARLAQESLSEAREFAERAVSLTRELGADVEEGIGLRVLGKVQLANGERDAALSAFGQSLALLADRDPYEAARTRAEWGACLVSAGEIKRGITLLRQARATFQELGARRDVVAVDEVWRGNH